MGSKHTASCDYGYSKDIVVGGSRSSFTTHSYFPYYCKKCGVVDVNVEEETIHCPQCNSNEVEQYGLKKVSDLSLNQTIQKLQYFSRKALENGNLCPQCCKFKMKLSSSSVIFS